MEAQSLFGKEAFKSTRIQYQQSKENELLGQPGLYLHLGNVHPCSPLLQAVFGDDAQRLLREKRESERKSAAQPQGDPNLIPLGVRAPKEVKEPEEPIPEVEWWDAGLLQNKLYELVEEEIGNLREDKITIYVEHPIPLEPPAEEVQPPPMPLPLTQKERKKLKTQR